MVAKIMIKCRWNDFIILIWENLVLVEIANICIHIYVCIHTTFGFLIQKNKSVWNGFSKLTDMIEKL